MWPLDVGMELIRGIHNILERHRGCVLTIGNFDGVHLGHQAVLRQVLLQAERLQLPSVVMLFEPQPREFFAPDFAPARLCRLRDKLKLLEALGIDRVVCVQFNQKFAQWQAEMFVEQLLVDSLGVKYLVVGDDFRFGCGRRGNFAMLREGGLKHGFDVINTHSLRLDQARVSSTAIRNELLHDRLDAAAQMLGRRFAISGRVVHGEALGRKLGFPTANLLLKRLASPVKGVFAVMVNINGGTKRWCGMANIGSRPTVKGVRQQLEVHLFDFAGDLYGKQLEVTLVEKLRDEMNFAGLEQLTEQLAKDHIAAEQVFACKSAVAKTNEQM